METEVAIVKIRLYLEETKVQDHKSVNIEGLEKYLVGLEMGAEVEVRRT